VIEIPALLTLSEAPAREPFLFDPEPRRDGGPDIGETLANTEVTRLTALDDE
jgi:hypothetical protein